MNFICERDTVEKDGEGGEEEQGDGNAFGEAQRGKCKGPDAFFILHFERFELFDALAQNGVCRQQHDKGADEYEEGDHILLLEGLQNVCDVCHAVTILYFLSAIHQLGCLAESNPA
ncbi:hypothetical protein SDC9_175227 [bioreactor metagenome]|uniref:Uncharacterized protein n=1 Tax=bioreactor metagenome TaxID=1076179 RepID=A0A645GVX1_9ZZZZ